MEFLAYTPPPADSPRRAWRELGIALRARRHGAVYLLKVPSLSLVRRVRRIAGAAVIFDLTDSLWRPEVGGSVWGELSAILAEADAVFTCNRYDTEHAARFNRNTVCLPPYAHVGELQRARATRPPRTEAGPVRIGWIGSPSTVRAIANVAGPLDAVAARNAGVTLRVVGCANSADLPAFRHLDLSLGPASYERATMIEELVDLDVGIFPIVIDEEDYCVRGPLKALTYMAAGVACICHRAGECARIIEDGRNGMLADSLPEWEAKLEQLVRDPALRRRLGEAALATIRESHSFEKAVADLEGALSDVLAGAKRRSAIVASAAVAAQLLRLSGRTLQRVVGASRGR
jgi:glycosyltransferase involved in cell wall biosynthesis